MKADHLSGREQEDQKRAIMETLYKFVMGEDKKNKTVIYDYLTNKKPSRTHKKKHKSRKEKYASLSIIKIKTVVEELQEMVERNEIRELYLKSNITELYDVLHPGFLRRERKKRARQLRKRIIKYIRNLERKISRCDVHLDRATKKELNSFIELELLKMYSSRGLHKYSKKVDGFGEKFDTRHHVHITSGEGRVTLETKKTSSAVGDITVLMEEIVDRVMGLTAKNLKKVKHVLKHHHHGYLDGYTTKRWHYRAATTDSAQEKLDEERKNVMERMFQVVEEGIDSVYRLKASETGFEVDNRDGFSDDSDDGKAEVAPRVDTANLEAAAAPNPDANIVPEANDDNEFSPRNLPADAQTENGNAPTPEDAQQRIANEKDGDGMLNPEAPTARIADMDDETNDDLSNEDVNKPENRISNGEYVIKDVTDKDLMELVTRIGDLNDGSPFPAADANGRVAQELPGELEVPDVRITNDEPTKQLPPGDANNEAQDVAIRMHGDGEETVRKPFFDKSQRREKSHRKKGRRSHHHHHNENNDKLSEIVKDVKKYLKHHLTSDFGDRKHKTTRATHLSRSKPLAAEQLFRNTQHTNKQTEKYDHDDNFGANAKQTDKKQKAEEDSSSEESSDNDDSQDLNNEENKHQKLTNGEQTNAKKPNVGNVNDNANEEKNTKKIIDKLLTLSHLFR